MQNDSKLTPIQEKSHKDKRKLDFPTPPNNKKQKTDTIKDTSQSPSHNPHRKQEDFTLVDYVPYGEVAMQPPSLKSLPKARLKGNHDYAALQLEKRRDEAVASYRALKRQQLRRKKHTSTKQKTGPGFYL